MELSLKEKILAMASLDSDEDNDSQIDKIDIEDIRRNLDVSKSSTAVAVDAKSSQADLTQVAEHRVRISCEDGDIVVSKDVFETFKESPLAMTVFGTAEGLQGVRKLPFPSWILATLDHFVYHKTLPRLQQGQEDALLAFADCFLLDSIVCAVEEKRKFKEVFADRQVNMTITRQKHREALASKFKENAQRHLIGHEFDDIGRLRGVLPPKDELSSFLR